VSSFLSSGFITSRPLVETSSGNKYVFLTIDHYSKWCETHHVKEHDEVTIARFLEKKIICQFGVAKYIFTNNGSEWMKDFDAMCQDYGIIHQFTTPAWPQCNGMVERLVQTIKDGLIVLSFTNIQRWDTQLPKILFGYHCGV
jgi:transposase InsO family protein